MHVTGHCHCGQISFEADIDPAKVGICHCTDCQVLSGTAYRATVPTLPGTLKLTGNLSTYLKVADSGTRRRQAFCPTCGSPIYATSDEDKPSVFGLRIGALDQRAELAPRRQIWCRSALPWSQDVKDLPQVEQQP